MTQNDSPQSRHRLQTSSRAGNRDPVGFAGDRRAISEILGGILMFGLIIGLLVLVQLNAVPAQNEQIEFEHSERVQQDLLELDDELLRTGSEGVPGSAQIELSARYPPRFFLLNPPVAAGAIETTALTTGTDNVTISNAVAATAPNYWTGVAKQFSTRTIQYRPNYNEYDRAPVTKYEHGVLVNAFESSALGVGDGTFVDGDQITLVTVDGRLSRATADAVAVETIPLSAPMQTVTVTNAPGQNIVLSLPTTLSRADWERLLANETVANGGAVQTPIGWSAGTPYNTLTVTLEPGSYELRMARVGVGTRISDRELGAHYLAADSDRFLGSLRQNETTQVVAQVRDRFNNPVEGEVTFTSDNGGFLAPDGSKSQSYAVRSGESGRASAVFEPYPGFLGTAYVNASADFNGDGVLQDRERVRFKTRVEPPTNISQNSTDTVSGINPNFPGSVQLVGISKPGSGTSPQTSNVTLTFRNNLEDAQTLEEVRMMFYIAQGQGSNEPASWGRVNAEPGDEFKWLGPWERVDSQSTSVTIPGGQEEPITFEFRRSAMTYDFFGISLQFTDVRGNYFVQVPNQDTRVD